MLVILSLAALVAITVLYGFAKNSRITKAKSRGEDSELGFIDFDSSHSSTGSHHHHHHTLLDLSNSSGHSHGGEITAAQGGYHCGHDSGAGDFGGHSGH